MQKQSPPLFGRKKKLPYHRTEVMHEKLPPQIKIKVLYELLLDQCYPIHTVISEYFNKIRKDNFQFWD